MKRCIPVLAACCAFGAMAAQAQTPNFKSKMKAGEYEYTMSMEMGAMPGMPPNMQGFKMPASTFKQCVTQQQIDEGNQAAMGQRSPGGKDMPKDCQVKDMKMAGDTVTYKMLCTGEMKMDADVAMTFTATGFKSQTKMKGERAGQPMNMISNMDAKYLGPCKS
jgi:hypothetical protein